MLTWLTTPVFFQPRAATRFQRYLLFRVFWPNTSTYYWQMNSNVLEVQPLVQKYGNHFDIFSRLSTLKESLPTPTSLLFCHEDGNPIIYNQYWKVITTAAKEAGMPGGSVGGHGGRIRMATLLAIQGKEDIYIMGRGRWRSTCWHTYVRLFTVVPNKHAISFRLADLNIDLSGYPPVSEFRK